MEPLRQKETNKQPILQVEIYLSGIEMPISECSHSLGGTRGSGDVILPLEDGLVLSHLLLDLVQEEGVLLTLGVAFHGGQHGIL